MPKDSPAQEGPTTADVPTAPAAREVKKTHAQWALELGHVRERKLHIALSKDEPSTRLSGEYRRAAIAHQWFLSDRLGHPAFHLTREEFERALERTTAGGIHEQATAPALKEKK